MKLVAQFFCLLIFIETLNIQSWHYLFNYFHELVFSFLKNKKGHSHQYDSPKRDLIQLFTVVHLKSNRPLNKIKAKVLIQINSRLVSMFHNPIVLIRRDVLRYLLEVKKPKYSGIVSFLILWVSRAIQLRL